MVGYDSVFGCSLKALSRQHLSLVRLGDQNLESSDDEAEPADYNIKSTFEHHLHDSFHKQHDIALIELERDVRFTRFIRPACLHQLESIGSVVIAVRRKIYFERFVNHDFRRVGAKRLMTKVNQRISERLH